MNKYQKMRRIRSRAVDECYLNGCHGVTVGDAQNDVEDLLEQISNLEFQLTLIRDQKQSMRDAVESILKNHY